MVALWSVAPRFREWFVGSCLIALDPALWTYSVVLWKDVWTASFSLFAGAFATMFLRTKHLRHLVTATVSTGIAISFRHNAVFLAAVPVALVWFATALGFRSRLMAATLTALFLLVFPKLFELPSNVRKTPIGAAAFIGQYVGLIVYLKEHASAAYEEELQLFDDHFGQGTAEQAVATHSVTMPAGGLLWPGGDKPPIVSAEAMNREFGFLISRIFILGIEYPAGYLLHRARNIRALFQMDEVHSPFYRSIDPNDFSLKESSMMPAIKAQVLKLLDNRRLNIFFRHYIFIALLLLSIPVFLRAKDYPPLAIVSVGVIYMGSLLVTDVWADWRFLLTTYCCSLVALYSVVLKSVAMTWKIRR